MSTWVRHISGQGEKWEVFDDGTFDADWKVKAKLNTGRLAGCHYLPKSEYVPCEAPEVWEEVAVEVLPHDGPSRHIRLPAPDRLSLGIITTTQPGYRVKSLVVEKRRGQ